MGMKTLINLLAEVDNKKKDLVGIKVQNDFIDDSLQEQPLLTVRTVPMIEESELIFTFIPEGKQYGQLQNLVDLLVGTISGELIGQDKVGEPLPPESDEEADYQSLTPKRYEVKIGVYFDMDSEVQVSHFTLNKVKYTQVSTTRMIGYVDQPFKVTLLFKENTSDSRTFFSDLVDTKLDKGTTKKVLNLLSNGNVTSTRVTMVKTQDMNNTFTMFPLNNVISLVSPQATDSDSYMITSGDSTQLFKEADVGSSMITKSMNKEYTFEIKVGKSTLILYLKY